MRLRASVECQIVLAGLACIVLSVWHPILCGNPVLWGWRKWDCGEWLHHCIRSCCWLLVTLKRGRRRKQLYTTEDKSNHQHEKLHTGVHVNIPPTATIILHSLLLSSPSKRARLAPLSHDTVFLIFLGKFLTTGWHTKNQLWGLQIACPCNLTQGFMHSKAVFWKGKEALKHRKREGNTDRRAEFFNIPKSTTSGVQLLQPDPHGPAHKQAHCVVQSTLPCCVKRNAF